MNAAGRGGSASSRGRHGTYFFLSYAHSPPVGDEARTDTDAWVSVFFRDLSKHVSRRARPASGLDIGFIDQQLPLGSDWKAVLAEALGATEVFVPLYSPGYFSKSWPMGERESFRERLIASGVADPARRVTPVLWIPFPSWEEPAEVGEALEIGGHSTEYAENGMRALCMLTSYRDAYRTVLDRLARRIVDIAERDPLAPSRAPNLDEVANRVRTDAAFVVAVLAPTVERRPAGRDPRGYADRGRLWQPFGERQALPVADHAASTAERLGLPTRIADLTDDAPELISRYPAVLLIDPWTVADPAAAAVLRDALHTLPDWVVPVVVADRDDPQYAPRGASLADEVMTMLSASGVPRAELVGQVKEFVEVMPALVTEARRQYLKNIAVFPPPGPPPSDRPRLGDSVVPPTREQAVPPTREEDR